MKNKTKKHQTHLYIKKKEKEKQRRQMSKGVFNRKKNMRILNSIVIK